MSRRPDRARYSWHRLAVLAVAVVVLGGTAKWLWWTERHPERERELRLQVQEQLHEWFPEQMELPDDVFGFIPRSRHFDDSRVPDVLLLHGLDEPGGIWDELIAAFDEVGINAWEFRYPNDQAIDHSADLLAGHWAELDEQAGLILVGHSMGGLVIRDFVTRWRYPADQTSRVDGARIVGTVLIAPPNRGSEWARLRAWLEIREWISDIRQRRFSLFAALRDGTGAAKIDLRPDSAFLADLNNRRWPDSVKMKIIGGVLAEPTPQMEESVAVLTEQFGMEGVAEELLRRWESLGTGLGDGVVPVESLILSDQPEPLVLDASHRGLLVRLPLSDGDPPAISPVVDTVMDWRRKGE
jgi:pimeloyl-ACP methyl ester carboxylesterase